MMKKVDDMDDSPIFYIGMFVVFCCLVVPWLYWLWLSFLFKSIPMAIFLIPPLIFISIPIGAWSIVFGVPDWVVFIFTEYIPNIIAAW